MEIIITFRILDGLNFFLTEDDSGSNSISDGESKLHPDPSLEGAQGTTIFTHQTQNAYQRADSKISGNYQWDVIKLALEMEC